MEFTNRISVLVLHRDPVAREGLLAAFARYHDIEVVNAPGNPIDARSLRPLTSRFWADVVVADYDCGSTLASRSERRSGAPDALKIMILAAGYREWEVRSALERGVLGYVLVGCALDDLASGGRAVHRGARHMSPEVAQRLAESFAGEPLTTREEEVLRLVVQGMGNKSIARRLEIAVGTVKSHLKGVFDKLGVDSRTQAICAAERRGLLSEVPRESETESVSMVADESAVHQPMHDVQHGIRAEV